MNVSLLDRSLNVALVKLTGAPRAVSNVWETPYDIDDPNKLTECPVDRVKGDPQGKMVHTI
jgi:hypothetical protein